MPPKRSNTKNGPQMEKSNRQGFKNSLDQHTMLSTEAFMNIFGVEWEKRTAKDNVHIVFSGDDFCLETLEGPDGGIMHKSFKTEGIQVLIIAKNQLTTISCLNAKDKFRSLQSLNVSRNMLTEVFLDIPSLTEVNLSHNKIELLPQFDQLHSLQKINLSHNRIDGRIAEFAKNKRLRNLDISSNRFSWAPSEYMRQLDELKQIHIDEFTIWPNPFAEFFTEYQFLTVTAMDSLRCLDGFYIDTDLRAELRVRYDRLQASGVDYDVFDIRVEERRDRSAPMEDTAKQGINGPVPCMQDLLLVLDKPLEMPTELIKHIQDFDQEVLNVWQAPFPDRAKLMEHRDARAELQARRLKPEEEENAVHEFVDKMQQMLGRFDSVQDVLIMCIVRLMACGIDGLGQSCGELLASWIDATGPDIMHKIGDMADALFKDLRKRTLLGIQSFNESPFECYEASHGRKGGADDEPEDQDLDDIAECASILHALKSFGPAFLYGKVETPYRSIVLKPFLPILCRQDHKTLGPEKERKGWQKYEGFDCFPEEKPLDLEIEPEQINTCEERCIRHGYGGFVTEEKPNNPGILNVYFKSADPETLIGLRRTNPARTLHTRPCAPRPRRKQDDADKKNKSWDAWHSGLAVLATASDDKHVAARCVNEFEIHRSLMKHCKTDFTEVWLLVTSEATEAYVKMMHLAENLMKASGSAREIAGKCFLEEKLHMACWTAIRRRLMDGGQAVQMAALTEIAAEHPAFTPLISALVSVVFSMQSIPAINEQVMTDLKANGDVFYLLLDIAADTGYPDPLLLASSFEAVYMFLDSDITRTPEVISRTLDKLHNAAILLPYLRGPKSKDADNSKYQELWRTCELKYNFGLNVRERLPELFGGSGADLTAWKKHVPELRDLTNPIMHRVLLGIVKLIELFSSKAQTDWNLRNVTQTLNEQDREALLIGPANGLVTCADSDVKIQCLRCIRQVLMYQSEQLSSSEMGWLMRYLTSTGIGVGRQEEFLMEVLELIMTLTRDKQNTGSIFRHRFAKAAIRESFEMLRVNSRREVAGNPDEEESKVALSLQIVQFLAICSRPNLSGGLRKFLRRVDFLKALTEIMHLEDSNDHKSCRSHLLCTWTGRDMREVLLPLVTGNQLRLEGLGRSRCAVRLADVIQGRRDYICGRTQSQDGTAQMSSNEKEWWCGFFRMKEELLGHDLLELQDWNHQQTQFIAAFGLSAMMEFIDRLFRSSDERFAIFNETQAMVQNVFVLGAEERAKKAWDQSATDESSKKEAEQSSVRRKTSHLEDAFKHKLEVMNLRVQTLFQKSLNKYDETDGLSALERLAKIYADCVEKNQETYRQMASQHPHQWRHVMELPNEYLVEGKLQSKSYKKHEVIAKCRQPTNDLKRLMEDAEAAHQDLKKALCKPLNQRADLTDAERQTEEWVKTRQFGEKRTMHLTKGLVEFINACEGTVHDPGLKDKDTLERKAAYKFVSGLSRARDISRVSIEYPTIEKLVNSLNRIKREQKLTIVRLRNRFRHPTGLGRRFIQLNVEVVFEGGKHICEIRLVARPPGGAEGHEQRWRNLIRESETILQDFCQVPKMKLPHVAEYIMYELEARGMRHGDIISLHTMRSASGTYVQTVGEKLMGADLNDDTGMNTSMLFYIEREDGKGTIKFGDIVYLKSKATEKYVDVANNGSIRVRHSETNSSDSYMAFKVEKGKSEHGGLGGGSIIGAISGMFSAEDGEESLGGHGMLLEELRDAVRSNATIRLKILGTTHSKYLTITTNVSKGDRYKVKAAYREDHGTNKGDSWNLPSFTGADSYSNGENNFVIIRQGSLGPFLTIESAESKLDQAGSSSDEQLEILLLESYMCAELPRQCTMAQEGGTFRRAPPSFRAIALKLTEKIREARARRKEGDESNSGQVVHKTVDISLMICAVFRTMYAMVMLPCSMDVRNYALNEVFNTVDRLLVAAITLQKQEPEETALTFAWLPAKLLRVLSSVMIQMPILSQAATNSFGSFPQNEGKEEAIFADRKRLQTLDVIAAYISRVITPPLAERLKIVGQKALDLQEIVLLREYAIAVDALMRAFMRNELRCDRKKVVKSGAGPSEAAPKSLGARGESIPVEEPSIVEQEESAIRESFLPADERAKIFAEIIPSSVIGILVHALLHGMHREAVAYNSGFQEESLVKVVSSLVNRTIYALATIMNIRDADPTTECDYDVCEAVSQAMIMGTQPVPKARAMQLISERAQDKARTAMQELLDETYQEQYSSFLQSSLEESGDGSNVSEKVTAVAYAWNVSINDNGRVSTEVPMRLVACTSRLNFIVCSIAPLPSDRESPVLTKDDLNLVKPIRSLENLGAVTLFPRMRQFLGLWWDKAKENQQNEILVFESSCRRREFLDVIRLAKRKLETKLSTGQTGSLKGVIHEFKGIPEFKIHNQFTTFIQDACKKERGNKSIVNMSFVRQQQAHDGSPLEVAVLTESTITVLTLQKVMQRYARFHKKEFYSADVPHGFPVDSDSDEDQIPQVVDGEPKDCDEQGLTPVEARANDKEPQQHKTLQGVWFLADVEPKMKMQWEGSNTQSDFLFTSDADRQRWRQHLARTLRRQEEAAAQEDAEAVHRQGWSKLNHDSVALKDVQTAAKHMLKERSANSLQVAVVA